jgi:hypothetical protein
MNITIRSSDFGELAKNPEFHQPHTATVVQGTGTFVAPISLLRDIARAPDAVRQLEDVIEALTEQEFLYAMAILDADDTGIANTLWFIPVPEGQHGPRIKVAIDPPRAVRPGGVEATVPFDRDQPATGPIPPALERQVREFIELNCDALLKYWRLEFPSTRKFISQLRPLPRR